MINTDNSFGAEAWEMRVETYGSDRILMDWDDYSETNFEELAKKALSLGLLEIGYRYRFGYGLEFIVLHDNGKITGHRYHFTNWKAWDDLFEISPPPNRSQDYKT